MGTELCGNKAFNLLLGLWIVQGAWQSGAIFPQKSSDACFEKIFTELEVFRNTSLAALVGTAPDKCSLLCAKSQ